jgi:uncharacterized protein YdaU (DUF1376 family)
VRAAWWWIDRWRKSTAYMCMNAEQQGLYRNLLDSLWLFESHEIPDEPRALLMASGGDQEAWARSGATVLKWMRKTDTGWTHDTALEVIERYKDIRESRSEAGKIGNQKRWGGDRKPIASAIANDIADGIAKGSPPSPSPSPSPSPLPEPKKQTTDSDADFATRFLAICGASFGRKYRVVDPEVKKKLKARLKDWKPWQILAAPILVAAQVPDRVANLSPEIILRDGSNPRTRDGQTYGGFYWLAKTYERVDGTRLDARLRSIAREAEVLEPLLACGVVVDADA